MIQYLITDNNDGSMTVVKISNVKQLASYKINMDVPTLDMLLETFVIQETQQHGLQRVYGEDTTT